MVGSSGKTKKGLGISKSQKRSYCREPFLTRKKNQLFCSRSCFNASRHETKQQLHDGSEAVRGKLKSPYTVTTMRIPVHD